MRRSPRFRIVVALLIALTSLLGALAAWRAEAASMKGDDAERAGFAQNIAAQRAQASIDATQQNTLQDYERAQAFLVLAKALRDQARTVKPADAARLRAQANADESRGNELISLLDPDAISPTGALDLQRQYRIQYQVAKNSEDLDSAPEYRTANRQGRKSERLVGLTAFFVAAAFFFTLAQVTRRRAAEQVYLGGGLLLLTATIVLFLLVVFTT